jgi:hypothetical protein
MEAAINHGLSALPAIIDSRNKHNHASHAKSYLFLDNFPEEFGGNAFLEAKRRGDSCLITLCEARFASCCQLLGMS